MMVDLSQHFTLNKVGREKVLALIEDLTLEQMILIPDGYNNNLLWNFCHIAVTQQLLTLGLSACSIDVPKELVDRYRKGSGAAGIKQPQQDLDYFTKNYSKLVEITEQQHLNGELGTFQKYQTSYGVELCNLHDAVVFNNIHEGIHLGYMMALKKLL